MLHRYHVLTSCSNLEKKIPGAPENETPVHLRKRQIYVSSKHCSLFAEDFADGCRHIRYSDNRVSPLAEILLCFGKEASCHIERKPISVGCPNLARDISLCWLLLNF